MPRCAKTRENKQRAAREDQFTIPSTRFARVRLAAQKAAIRERQEAAEAEAAAKYKIKVQLEEEKAAKTAAQALARKEKAEAAKLAKAAEKKASATQASAAAPAKAKKGVPEVQKINAKADRVAARIAAGEDAPSLFGL